MRLFGLDYLRGLAAFSIMIFHYTSWTYGETDASTLLGKIGIYGVEVFYILSGITLYYVYYERMTLDKKGLGSFYKKRMLRIFPLLWLATLSVVAIAFVLSKELPDLRKLFLNLTGLFGIFSWDEYYAVGAWSIGNELVFYLFFPVFVFLLRKYPPAFVVFALIITGYFVFSAFLVLDPEVSLSSQWKKYTHPFNQVFYFLAGFTMAHIFKKVKVSNWLCLAVLIFGAVLFVVIPSDGDLITIVTKWNRILYTFCCLLICFAFYKLTYEIRYDRPLTLLGEASYSVYLLHPIVFSLVGIITMEYRIIISIVCTLVGSYFVYEYFEKRFLRYGKKRS